MLKQIILLLNLFSLSFVTYLLSGGIEYSTNLPEEIQRDSTYIIEVIIDKGDLFGFAKFQQNFPEGFDAKPVETAEASFTYADGKVKFIWMALPEEPEVKISFALTASADVPEISSVDGKFSYIQDNERKSYDLPVQEVRIKAEEDAEPAVPAMASVARSVTPLGGNSYEVNLTVTKQGIVGFSKLEELLPVGAEAEVMENKTSVFSQVDEKAKYVWMSIPEGETLDISYKVSAKSDILEELETMEGNFSFLVNQEIQTVPIIGRSVEETAQAIASKEEPASVEIVEQVADEPQVEETSEIAAEETAPEEIVEPAVEQIEEPVEEEVVIAEQPSTPEAKPVEEEIAIEEPQTKEEEPLVASAKDEAIQKPITNIPAPQTGIVYRVQIIAGHHMITEDYLRNKYKFQDSFVTENHEGWIKWTTGGYDVYKSARDKREDLVAANHQFPGPFVTAYNQGERITVQEALMISNQKWLK